MKKVRIGFWGMDSILEFVTIAGKCKEKMELMNGDCIVNAKSLLSVLSLVTAEAVELIIQEESCDSLLNRLDLYVEHGRLLGGKNIVF
ncbi:phosphocarrier protein [Lacrimispora xylanisolvens]|jgi:phosphocarrier protein|uniref:Phosphocarrier protein n=1 Tax=Lacrimispora xylanisolvens TaxID=384636 RepID=A0A2S6HRW2_9FIRM|nr:HPr family phosphocarrier protein [Hungatella xylanolytica]MBE5988617.1 HPr family phosphocarrier protein [Paenibacillaceae bacterium]MBE5992048.1 HPr family phosphocarrier protein [Paenibacillaceae bacterium]MTK08831.1 HPr family phosphocarrier protein [Hungatella sp.]PPK80267.1 phosphocarrier protein [Hungatella xylanolytica]